LVSHVDAFCRRAGENDLVRLRTGQVGDSPTSLFDNLGGFPTSRVISAEGVAKVLAKRRGDHLQHRRVDQGGAVVVEVDQFLGSHGFAYRRSSSKKNGSAPFVDALGLYGYRQEAGSSLRTSHRIRAHSRWIRYQAKHARNRSTPADSD
jgi:hypothetical protein